VGAKEMMAKEMMEKEKVGGARGGSLVHASTVVVKTTW